MFAWPTSIAYLPSEHIFFRKDKQLMLRKEIIVITTNVNCMKIYVNMKCKITVSLLYRDTCTCSGHFLHTFFPWPHRVDQPQSYGPSQHPTLIPQKAKGQTVKLPGAWDQWAPGVAMTTYDSHFPSKTNHLQVLESSRSKPRTEGLRSRACKRLPMFARTSCASLRSASSRSRSNFLM